MASQCARILEVLGDRRPHRMEEIHARAGFMRLNSRISELRDRGYGITCDKTGGEYVYTLVSLPAESAPALGADCADSAGSESGVGHSAVTGSAADIAGEGRGSVRLPRRPVRRSHFDQLLIWDSAA
jgi:hypothetical protein